MRNFAQKFKPLYSLLKSKDVKVSTRKSTKPVQRKQLSSKQSIQWTSECQKVVDETICFLRSPQFLVYPNYDLPFNLHVDASQKGLGAVLYQKQEGKNRVVSFASRTLSEPECNYHLHSGKLEFLALKWAVTERFADYLCYGPPFTVYTDNNPLTYVMSTSKLNAVGLRWVGELANFQFSLKYKPGKKHGDADGLSRVLDESLQSLDKSCTVSVPPEEVASLMSIGGNSDECSKCPAYVNVNLLQWDSQCSSVGVEQISKEELHAAQVDDPDIGPVFRAVADQNRQKCNTRSWSRKSKVLLKQYSHLKIGLK